MLQLVSAAVLAVAAAAPQYLAAPWAHGGLVHHAPLVQIQDDGQYRTGHLDRAIDLRGEYVPDAEGRYLADDEGSYKPDQEGAYKPDDEGAYKPDAEGQYDAASAHATEALSEDGSYRGEPIAVAYAAGIHAPIHTIAHQTPLVRAVAHAPWATNLGYSAFPGNFVYRA